MARPSTGKDKVRGYPHTGTASPDESDLDSEFMGKNRLHGENQAETRNQRRTVPDEQQPDRRKSHDR